MAKDILNNTFNASMEAGVFTTWAAEEAGRWAVCTGVQLIKRLQPGYISEKVRGEQAVLRHFPGHFSLDGHLLESGAQTDAELDAEVATATDTMVEGGVVDEHTSLVELRAGLPEDIASDPDRLARCLRVLKLFKHHLVLRHRVNAMYDGTPVVLRGEDSLAPFVPELSDLEVQAPKNPAFIGFVPRREFKKILLGNRVIHIPGRRAARDDAVVLGSVPDDHPENNLLLGLDTQHDYRAPNGVTPERDGLSLHS